MHSLSSHSHKLNFSISFVSSFYISWLELDLFVLQNTSYFHIYIFLLIKTSKILYFHWDGKGGKLTAIVVTTSLPTSILLTKTRLFFFSWFCWFSGWETNVHINYSYLVINNYSENVPPPPWEAWYTQKGFRRLIIILSILIATVVHFFNAEYHILFLTYLRVFLFAILKSEHLFSKLEILNTSNFFPIV